MFAITRALTLAERLVVAVEKIADELHGINDTLYQIAFDPNCDTTFDRIHSVLHDALQTFDRHDLEKGRSLAAHVARLARALDP